MTTASIEQALEVRPALALIAGHQETCDHHMLGDPTAQRCIRPPHSDRGHVYHDPTGSFVVDDDHESGRG